MKILLINSEYPPIGGGAGNASANLARCLADLGHEIVVMTSRYQGLPRTEIVEGVRIMRLPGRRKRADRSSPVEQLSFLAGGVWGVIREVRRWQPDATIAFFGMPAGGIAFLSHLITRQPYIVSLRGGDVPGFRPYDFKRYHQVIGPLLRRIWRRASAVVANSQGLRSMAQAFERKVPIEIIPNGVDTWLIQPGDRAWQPARMLFVGRVVYQKGLDLLLHSLADLRDREWELTIVGDGPLRPSLETLAANLGIAERIHFVGWKKGGQLWEAYRQANLFTYPSRHEGMPNVVLEAMAAGLPVIATRIAGNEELVIPESTGLLIEPENQQQLEQALDSLLDDPARREAFGRAARARTESDYPWERVAEQYLNILERIVADQD